MLTVILMLNVFFLILTIIFAIKVRSDFENFKKGGERKEDDEIKLRLLGIEERISSLEEELKNSEQKRIELKINHKNNQSSPNIPAKVAKSENEQNEKNEQNENVEAERKTCMPKLTQSMIISLFREGKKEEEIANLLGLSFEEVKLILTVLQKGNRK